MQRNPTTQKLVFARGCRSIFDVGHVFSRSHELAVEQIKEEKMIDFTNGKNNETNNLSKEKKMAYMH